MAACVTPNVPFYDAFMGVTLGVTAMLGYLFILWLIGSAIARMRALPLARRVSYNRTLLSRVILLLILVCACRTARAPACTTR